jgi:hypothetical protein
VHTWDASLIPDYQLKYNDKLNKQNKTASLQDMIRACNDAVLMEATLLQKEDKASYDGVLMEATLLQKEDNNKACYDGVSIKATLLQKEDNNKVCHDELAHVEVDEYVKPPEPTKEEFTLPKINFKPGEKVYIGGYNGKPVEVTVVEVDGKNVLLSSGDYLCDNMMVGIAYLQRYRDVKTVATYEDGSLKGESLSYRSQVMRKEAVEEIAHRFPEFASLIRDFNKEDVCSKSEQE